MDAVADSWCGHPQLPICDARVCARDPHMCHQTLCGVRAGEHAVFYLSIYLVAEAVAGSFLVVSRINERFRAHRHQRKTISA